jgi:hypothetical protein
LTSRGARESKNKPTVYMADWNGCAAVPTSQARTTARPFLMYKLSMSAGEITGAIAPPRLSLKALASPLAPVIMKLLADYPSGAMLL